MRLLAAGERAVLERQGCRAEDWDLVRVADDFRPDGRIEDVAFSGEVSLGSFSGRLETVPGFREKTGLYGTRLYAVSIGDDCLVRDSVVANADVGRRSLLDRVSLLTASGESGFGNGLECDVLSEAGGRSVPLWEGLSSPLAHILCHLAGDPAAERVRKFARERAPGPCRSTVGMECRIERAGRLENVALGDGARIDGVSELRDCAILSALDSRTLIGEGVSASECVFAPRSEVSGGVRLKRCFVGENCRLRDGFSGEHSLFFANCDLAKGEAVSVMAGPLAVSHHKATLLLTCQCSFTNFGSGANSSNHHYKIGAVHGGVMDRGAKMGSGAYLFWPSRIGAFTTVIGRHARSLSTEDFPFSLLVGDGGVSRLIPAANLFTAGTYRDNLKWRDRSSGAAADLYHLDALSPFTLQAVDRAIDRLKRAGAGEDLPHGGAVIPAARVQPALALYEAAATFATGKCLLERVFAGKDSGLFSAVLVELGADAGGAGGEWRDWGGLLLPADEGETFLRRLRNGELAGFADIRRGFGELHAGFGEWRWKWLAARWRRIFGPPRPESAKAFLVMWKRSVLVRRDGILKDIRKEFFPESAFGFGLERPAGADFLQARGSMDENRFTRMIREESDRLLERADAVLETL